MKKLRICLLVLAFVLSGCSFPGAAKNDSKQAGPALENSESNFQYIEPLTLDDLKRAFSQEGLILTENGAIGRNEYLLSNITPAFFSINASEQNLLIYIFDSIADRKQIPYVYTYEDHAAQTPVFGQVGDPIVLPTQFDNLPAGIIARSFVARNVLIIDMIDLSHMDNVMSNEDQVFKNLRKVVSFLNKSQTITFEASSKNWDADYAVEYYQHWYKDNAGLTQIDQSAIGKWSVKYIGANPESIKDIRYSYKTPARGGNGDGIFEKDGDFYCLRLDAGGDDAIPNKDGVYTLTITSDGHEETLDLKPVYFL